MSNVNTRSFSLPPPRKKHSEIPLRTWEGQEGVFCCHHRKSRTYPDKGAVNKEQGKMVMNSERKTIVIADSNKNSLLFNCCGKDSEAKKKKISTKVQLSFMSSHQ